MNVTLVAEWMPASDIRKHPELHSTVRVPIRILVRHIQDGKVCTDWARYYPFFDRWTIDGFSGIKNLGLTHFLDHKFEN